MSNRTVLITGGARRLGAAIARTLAEQGHALVIHYNSSSEAAKSLQKELRAAGAEVNITQARLEDAESCEKLAQDSCDLSGPITDLINSASIFPEDVLDEISSESVARNMNVNALVPMFLGRALKARGELMSIVNLLDTRVLDYDAQHVSYHLSKRSLQSLTAMMAMEWAPVRVNGVAPGLILPPEGKDESYLESLKATNPLNTYGEPEDIARSVTFLLNSPFITGQTIYVDGGRHLKGRFYE